MNRTCDTRKIIVPLMLLAMFAASTPLFATERESPLLSTKRQEIQGLYSQQNEIRADMRRVRSSLVDKSTEIETWKERKKQRQFTPYIDHRIRSLLKSAQALAKELTSLENKQGTVRRQIALKQEILLRDLEVEIETTVNALAKSSLAKEEKTRLAKRLQRYISERNRLIDIGRERETRIEISHALPNTQDSLEELQEKSAFLHDVKDDIRRKIKRVRGKIARIEKQNRLYKEMEYFLDEEAFFAEASFAKRQPAQQAADDATKDNDSALEDESTLETKREEDQQELDPTSTGDSGEIPAAADTTANPSEEVPSVEENPETMSDSVAEQLVGTVETVIDNVKPLEPAIDPTIQPEQSTDRPEIDTTLQQPEDLRPIRQVELSQLSGRSEQPATKRLGSTLDQLFEVENRLRNQLKEIEEDLKVLESRISVDNLSQTMDSESQ